MPFNPDGTYSLSQSFGTGTPPSNDFPPQVGSVLDDIAANLNATTLATVIGTVTVGQTLQSLVAGSPTGGNEGQGSINAQSIFQNGSAVFVQTGTAAGGVVWTTANLGTLSGSNTIFPLAATCLKQQVTNNGTLVLSGASLSVGDVELLLINGASAASLALTGFSKTFTGDPYTTTNGNAFVVYMYGFAGSRTAVVIKALQ